MHDLRQVIFKPYVRADITLDVMGLSPSLQTKIRKAFERGYIDTQNGDSRLVFDVIAQRAGLPIIVAPVRGNRERWFTVDYRHTQKPKELIETIEELFKAEQVAAKMLHGHVEKEPTNYWRHAEKQPRSSMYATSATWTFKNTNPAWADVIKDVFNRVEWMREARKEALDIFTNKKITFSYNGKT